MKKLRTATRVLRTFGWKHTIFLTLKKINIHKDTEVVDLARYINIKNEDDLLSFLRNKLEIDDKLIDCATKLISELDGNETFSKSYRRTQFFDENYDIGKNTGFILTALVLKLNPRIVLETGVAAGLSSSYVLKALSSLPKKGRLVSVDITEGCGELIPSELKELWNLEILRGRKQLAFETVVKQLEWCDVFIHDSDHSSKWQNFEIATVLQYFPDLRILIVDDPTAGLLNNEMENFERVVIGEENKIAAIFVRK